MVCCSSTYARFYGTKVFIKTHLCAVRLRTMRLSMLSAVEDDKMHVFLKKHLQGAFRTGRFATSSQVGLLFASSQAILSVDEQVCNWLQACICNHVARLTCCLQMAKINTDKQVPKLWSVCLAA